MVHICQSYYQTSRGLGFFGTRCIVAVTEAKPKKFSGQIRPSEFHLDGYKIFHEGVSEDNFRGIVVYVSKDLTVTQMEPNIPFRECLLIRIEMAVGDNVIFGTFYRSPNIIVILVMTVNCFD